MGFRSFFFSVAICPTCAASCGLAGFRFWARIPSPFLGPAILTRAAEVPVFGSEMRTPIQGQKQSPECAFWPAFLFVVFFFAIYIE